MNGEEGGPKVGLVGTVETGRFLRWMIRWMGLGSGQGSAGVMGRSSRSAGAVGIDHLCKIKE
jgi:hypothetical protein